MKFMKKRVVIAMSGGVDSSVTAALLQREGYECIGMHVRMWEESVDSAQAKAKNKCCTLSGLEDARWVCEKLDIPFYVMNAEESFKRRVVDYFLETSSRGETPNPCVECNREIKFGELLKRAAELKADFLASGHYAKISQNPQGDFGLHMADDRSKDQSYFLYHLSQEKLSRILFPLGGMKKTEVYECAKNFGLSRVVEKPQSQGLCFFAEGAPKYFLQRYLPSKIFAPGPIISTDGRKLGTHRGLPLYTIGQRSGLGIGGIAGEPEGEAWYVVATDPQKNALIVGREEEIFQKSFECEHASWISRVPFSSVFDAEIRIRHRGSLAKAHVEPKENGLLSVTGHEPFRGVAAGQSAVFYDGDRVIGGGIIKSAHARHATARNIISSHRRHSGISKKEETRSRVAVG